MGNFFDIFTNVFFLSLPYSYLGFKKFRLVVKFSNLCFCWIYSFWGCLNLKISFSVNSRLSALSMFVCACLFLSVRFSRVLFRYHKINYSRLFNFGIFHGYLIKMLYEFFFVFFFFNESCILNTYTVAYEYIQTHYGLLVNSVLLHFMLRQQQTSSN